ncbi:ferritin family protein [Clostridium sp. DL1XJH146]
MSYTTERQPQGIPYFFTNKIREAMIGELVAINDYSIHISHSNIKELNEIWYHIMEDEKKHFGMLMQLLRKYDPVEYEKYKEVASHVKLTGKGNLSLSEYNKSDNTKLLNNIRSDIKGELEAIILYEQHIIEIPHPDIKKVFEKIVADEKEHTEELTLAILHYDKNSYGPISCK